ncbi:hypothetical protein ACFQX7_23430 [Luedemannella flava]
MAAAGAGFRLLARELSARADGIRVGAGPLRDAWRGQARDAAVAAFDRVGSKLLGAADAVFACAQVLAELDEQARTARALLERGTVRSPSRSPPGPTRRPRAGWAPWRRPCATTPGRPCRRTRSCRPGARRRPRCGPGGRA